MVSRRAFTLLELLIAIAVLAMITALLVPVSNGADDRGRLNTAAWILTSDLEFAQVVSITHPKDPVVVRFDVATNTYWLANASDPDVPLEREDTGEPYLVTLGQGRAATAEGVTFTLQDFPTPGDTLRFEPHGGLSNFNLTPHIIIKPAGKDYPRIQLTIAPTTGTVMEEYQRSP